MVVLFSLLIIGCSPQTGKNASANVYTYWIDSARVPCTSVVPQQCLRVKKGTEFATAEWQYFYGTIEGFDYEPGSVYQLRIKETPRSAADTPADASSIIYSLVEIVEKKPDAKLRLYDIWALEAIDGEEMDFTDNAKGLQHPSIEFNLTEMRVMGTDGCNRFQGAIDEISGTKLQLGGLFGTEMACPDMATPRQINQALSAVAAYDIKGLKLQLLDKSGKVLLRYRKVD